MRDPQEAIRTAYFKRLSGAVTLAGVPIRVYSYFVTGKAERPYILLSQQTVADGRTGNCPSSDTSILVEVVTEYEGQAVKASDADRIATQIIHLLDEFRIRGDYMEGFEFNRHYLESSNMLNEVNGAKMINRRLLRFRDVVFEL